jgi:hypothetical protein
MRSTLAVALVLMALPAGTAAASDFQSGDPYGSSPSGQSAGDQYVETVPTTRGPRAPSHHKRARKLSPHVTRKIETLGGSDSAALKTLATSTALDAPVEHAATGGKAKRSSSRSNERHGGSTPAVPSAAINAAGGGEAGLGWLVVALLAITALALGAAGYQRHRHKGSVS